MTKCELAQESMGRWLDGELRPAESESLRAHVEDCAACGEAKKQFEKLNWVLKQHLTRNSGPIDFAPFWRGVERRIEQKRAWYELFLDRCRELVTPPRLAWSVPALIAVVLVVFSLDFYMLGWQSGGARNSFASVESIDAYGRSVALLRENETKTTVIWLYQDQEGENEAADDATKSGPAF